MELKPRGWCWRYLRSGCDGIGVPVLLGLPGQPDEVCLACARTLFGLPADASADEILVAAALKHPGVTWRDE